MRRAGGVRPAGGADRDDRDTVQAHEWRRRGSPTVPKGFSAAVWSAYP